jgi:hypothetical protein
MIRKCAIGLFAPILLAGCSAAEHWEYRYGPDNTLPIDKINASVAHQLDLIDRFQTVSACEPLEHPQCGYQVTLAGFNFIDEQCDIYLHELFVIDKERDRLKAGLQAADKMSNAVLATVDVSKTTMAIVAQSFGLSTQLLDVATDSYLYKTNPGTILHIVAELQTAYRANTEKNKAFLISHPAVYAQIRGYLRLCLPPTIESKIENALAKATADAGKNSDASPAKTASFRHPVPAATQAESQSTELVID